MIEVICSELIADLEKAFPNLTIEQGRLEPIIVRYFTVAFCNEIERTMGSGITIWLYDDSMAAGVWSENHFTTTTTYLYSDPAAFDRVQSLISEQYEAYLIRELQSVRGHKQ